MSQRAARKYPEEMPKNVEPLRSTPEKKGSQGSPLDGLFSDAPDLVEEVCADAYKERSTRRLRTSGG